MTASTNQSIVSKCFRRQKTITISRAIKNHKNPKVSLNVKSAKVQFLNILTLRYTKVNSLCVIYVGLRSLLALAFTIVLQSAMIMTSASNASNRECLRRAWIRL